MLLYGELINETDTPQEILAITGTFYDGQGQVVAGEEQSFEYIPVEVLPPGARTPFELIVDGAQAAVSYELRAQFEPSDAQVSQNFEFSDLDQWIDELEAYRIEGTIRNVGAPLTDYLTILAVLYDSQGNVLNFGEYLEPYPRSLTTDATASFDFVIDPPHEGTVRYELIAFGR